MSESMFVISDSVLLGIYKCRTKTKQKSIP